MVLPAALPPISALPASGEQPPWVAEIPVPPHQDIWVFGYGSLMWNPGFPYVEMRRARVLGYHRRFCIASHHYRGTPDRPGLVLGLDHGGSCQGIAYRVRAADVALTMQYLWDREMINRVYRPKIIRLQLGTACPSGSGCNETGFNGTGLNGTGFEIAGETTGDMSGAKVTACTFVVDRKHAQYYRAIDIPATARQIAAGHGIGGSNRAYLYNTVDHLRALGIHDARLESLRAQVESIIEPTG